MAKYLILIYGDEQHWAARTEAEQHAVDAAHRELAARAGDRLLSSGQLTEAATATTLRGRGEAGPLVTDGPFAETKEALGGFYLLEAEHLDDVIALATLLPEAREDGGAVQIQPLVDHG